MRWSSFARLIALLFVVSCASAPQITASWQQPGHRPRAFSKLAVIALTGRQETRRMIESQIIADLHELGIEAVAGTDLFDEPPRAEQRAAIRERFRRLGIDGAIAVRLVSRSISESTTAPVVADPAPNRDFYWDYTPFFEVPARDVSVTAKTRLVVECGLFEIEHDGAIGVREITVNDAGTIQQVRRGSHLLVRSFARAGLLAAKRN
jgi:hypothetical protein